MNDYGLQGVRVRFARIPAADDDTYVVVRNLFTLVISCFIC